MMFKKKNRGPHPGQDDRMPLEKGDLSAMLVAAFAVYLPVLLVVIGVIMGIIWLFFLR